MGDLVLKESNAIKKYKIDKLALNYEGPYVVKRLSKVFNPNFINHR